MNDTRRIEYLPLSQLKADPRNPKDHDIDEIKASISRFGFNDAVIIDERTGLLVSGHGRVEALRALEKADSNAVPQGVASAVIDDDGNDTGWRVPVQRGWSSSNDTEAAAFIVAANRLVEVGGWEQDKLEAILKGLAVDPSALVGVGYDANEIEALINRPDVVSGATDAAAEWEGMPEFKQEDKTAFRTLLVHFASQADVDAFAALLAQTITDRTRFMWYPKVERITYSDKAYVAE